MTDIVPGCSVRISGCPKRYAHLEGQVGEVVKASNGWVSVRVNGDDVSMRASNLEVVVRSDEQIDEAVDDVDDDDDDDDDVPLVATNPSKIDTDNEGATHTTKEVVIERTVNNDSNEEEVVGNDDSSEDDEVQPSIRKVGRQSLSTSGSTATKSVTKKDDRSKHRASIGGKSKDASVLSHPPAATTDNDDDDDDDSDDDIKALVDKALDNFAVSKFQPRSKVFAALHNRLLGSGRIVSGKLKDTEGVIREQQWKKGNNNVIEEAQRNAAIYDPQAAVAPPLKAPKPLKDESLGKGWFNMTPMKIDENLKRDIKIIQMRNYLDPKRFYKNPDKITKVLHVGTVIEGSSEYNSSRMKRKERKQSIIDEILADSKIKDYTKRKYSEIQKDRSNKRKVYKKEKKDKGGNRKKLRAYF